MPRLKLKTQKENVSFRKAKLKVGSFNHKKDNIWNLVFGIWSLSSGFTLIEFVVVMGILGFVVASTVLFLNSVLKGANQTNINQEVKQNGQVVLDSLDKQIRGSIAVVGVEGGPVDYTAIELTRLNDDPLYIKCFTDGAKGVKNNRIATAVSASGSPTYVSISNDNTVTGVDISGCKFNIVAAATSAQGVQVPAVVTVTFTASQGLDAPNRQDFAATASFVTTISLRTY